MEALLGKDSRELETVLLMIQRGIDEGVVRPLSREVFTKAELTDAFRVVKEDDKVLIKVL